MITQNTENDERTTKRKVESSCRWSANAPREAKHCPEVCSESGADWSTFEEMNDTGTYTTVGFGAGGVTAVGAVVGTMGETGGQEMAPMMLCQLASFSSRFRQTLCTCLVRYSKFCKSWAKHGLQTIINIVTRLN